MLPCCTCGARWPSHLRPALRADVLFELGQLETMAEPAEAARHLREALTGTAGWPRRGEITLALSEALALGGRFADAVGLLARTAAEAGEESRRVPLEAALLNTARMDIGTRAVTRPLLERITARAARGDGLDPQLHANLAIELAASRPGPRARCLERARGTQSHAPADVGEHRRAP